MGFERRIPMKVHELFAYLHVKDAAKAIEFYKQAFGAQEKFRLSEPGGRIGHAELVFNGTTLMLSDEFPEHGIRGPQANGETSVTIHLHVDDADEMIERRPSGGCDRAQSQGPVLRRAFGTRARSVRPPLKHRPPHRGRVLRRDPGAVHGDDDARLAHDASRSRPAAPPQTLCWGPFP